MTLCPGFSQIIPSFSVTSTCIDSTITYSLYYVNAGTITLLDKSGLCFVFTLASMTLDLLSCTYTD